MKELLQQTVGNELIHCQKLSRKTKHIEKKKKKEKNILKKKKEKKRPGPTLEILATV